MIGSKPIQPINTGQQLVAVFSR